jgi:hypothetical protein
MAWVKRKVSLTMVMSTGGPASDGGVRHAWHIKIDDDASGVRIVSVELPPEAFARALAGHYLTNVDAEMLDPESFADRVGKRHDVKTVNLPVGAIRENKAVLDHCREAIKPYLIDGWLLGGELDDYNWHRFNQAAGAYSVSLHRWVDPSTPEEPKPALAAKPTKKKPKAK